MTITVPLIFVYDFVVVVLERGPKPAAAYGDLNMYMETLITNPSQNIYLFNN